MHVTAEMAVGHKIGDENYMELRIKARPDSAMRQDIEIFITGDMSDIGKIVAQLPAFLDRVMEVGS